MEKFNVDAMAQAIERLLFDYDLVQKIVINARKIAKKSRKQEVFNLWESVLS